MEVTEELEGQGQGLKQVGKDLFAGACGGIAQVLLGKFVVFMNQSPSILYLSSYINSFPS